MKHINISLFVAVPAIMLLSSCKGYLDEDPKGRLTPSTFYASKEDIQLALNALYTKVEDSQSSVGALACQWAGDDITTHPGLNKSEFREFDRFAPSNNNSRLNDAWNCHYNIVMCANGIINEVGKTPVDTTIINTAMGNAKYWRAYAYFYLVRMFGPLPLNTTNTQEDYTTPLSSVPDVYALIVKDLTDAIAMLPTGYSEVPSHLYGVDVFVTSQAARATLAAVYMAMAGFPMNKTEYYAEAAKEAKAVLDGNYYTMDSDWSNVHSIGNNYNKETIIGINNSPLLGSWTHVSAQSSSCILASSGFNAWNDAMGEIQFWVDFPEGIRKDCVYEPKILRQSDMKLYDWWAIRTDTTGNIPVFPEYHPAFCVFTYNGTATKLSYTKFDYTQTKYEGMTTDMRHRIIRIPEVMLWYAESAARSGQDLTEAKKYLKMVHNRACDEKDAINGVPIDAMSADQLADACYREHGWENACNWVALVTRRSDQFRMNTLKDNFERRKVNAPVAIPGTPYTAQETTLINDGDVWDDMKNYLPYPDNDSKKNPNLVRKSLLD